MVWLLSRKRAREVEAERAILQEMAVQRRRRRLREAGLSLSATIRHERRYISRALDGWQGSTLYGYLQRGDESVYKENFRVSKQTFDYIVEMISGSGFLCDSMCKNPEFRVTARFKVAVCLYYFAHGCAVSKLVGDVASIGKSTVELYLKKFCEGVLVVLKPIFMPSTPPSTAKLANIKAEFAKRRGIPNVAMAVDGTHVPFRGGPDYRNYKGWTSILALAYVNSFHLFVDADVGAAGRAGDNGILKNSWLLLEIEKNHEPWLGRDGLIAADGGASDGGRFLLNPICDASAPEDVWYNFCHSSTRFFVEETFGRWKNRFRFLLREMHLSHKMATNIIYVSMILHNLCTIRNDDAVDFKAGADEEWQLFFDTFGQMSCPSCTRKGTFHCPHVSKWANAASDVSEGSSAAEKRDSIKRALWLEVLADHTAAQELAMVEQRVHDARCD